MDGGNGGKSRERCQAEDIYQALSQAHRSKHTNNEPNEQIVRKHKPVILYDYGVVVEYGDGNIGLHCPQQNGKSCVDGKLPVNIEQ
ncbi:hypothetical protein KGMB02408_17320 [Bacteroides faecalis]|uniref:Uncharacterized protein n=1 Tax=Bacteroides faecalis TaxID=2447885 RepID=A0A401LTP6_9BACE|nr:hypothetical protein KGMB02408_17320 [Bacteroides faecalis]